MLQKIEVEGVDRFVYRGLLPNGLDVIMIPNPDRSKKKNYYINYVSHYGALIDEFVPKNGTKMRKYPAGIAHFLEHKVFEMEEGNAYQYFSETGSYVNAFTSYKATCYVVSGSKKMEENLMYLLDLVNTPYFTKENVIKEQGIIQEELHMREDNPDYQAVVTLNRNLYHKLLLNTPIGGTEASIKKITPTNLLECYETFYQPSNMFLVIAGAIQPELLWQRLKQKFAQQENKQVLKVKQYREPLRVVKAYEELSADIEVEKLAIGYKMKRSSFPVSSDVLLDMYLNMFLTLAVGASSEFNEYVRRNHLASRSGYNIQDAFGILTLLVEVDTLHSEEYLAALEQHLQEVSISLEDFERIKKVWISSEVIKSDYADAMLDSFVDDMISYQDIVTNYVALIRSMNLKTMKEVIAAFDFSNRALVKMVPQHYKKK